MSKKSTQLTPKNEKFVRGLIKGMNQYDAYLYSRPDAKKWKRNSIDCNASQLFSDTKIQQRYNELLEKANNQAVISKAEAINMLDDMLLANTSQFFDIENGKLKLNVESLNHPAISEIKFDPKTGFIASIKTTDNKSLIETKAKLQGWNEPDKIEHNVKGASIINFADTSKAENE